MRVWVNHSAAPRPADLRMEMVERKGIGHPDTMCDGIAEAFSIGLSRFYLERYGTILHHNVDKALLWGGAARPAFGGGEIVAPMEIFLAGRATTALKGVTVPVQDIANRSTREWLTRNLRYVDVERHVRIHPLVRATSSDLTELFARGAAGVPRANDTSLGVGFAPLDALEKAVLDVEQALNSPVTRKRHPYIGEDIKVMGARDGWMMTLTVACAFVGRHLAGLAEYQHAKEEVRELALAAARNSAQRADIEVAVNSADGDSAESIYLTVTGTSAEVGDDGQVGRGNRSNGLITPYRPMSLEALAGKNPVSHVGKIYNIAANRIASAVVKELPAVTDAACYLLSGIGVPIDEPQLVDIQVHLADPQAFTLVERRVAEITRAEVAALSELWRSIVLDAEDA